MAERNILVLSHDHYFTRIPREKLADLGYVIEKINFHELEDSLKKTTRYVGAVFWTGSELPDQVRMAQETIRRIEEYDSSLPIVAIVAGQEDGSEYGVYREALNPRTRVLPGFDMDAKLLANTIDDIISKRN